MIGQIRGVLVDKKPPDVLLEVNGITYEIQVPLSTLYQLPEVGKQLLLHTHFVVREDAQLLYGFYDAKDKAMFRALLKVNGVGPKMALAILSGIAADALVRTIRNNDLSALTSVSGVGKKTAERLIIEMRDRLDEWSTADAAELPHAGSVTVSKMTRDAETALIGLGYKPQQAARSIALVLKDNPEVAESEQLIRLALKSMG
ncbi:MAG: Holliday junction branch migration protein RuvA [Gammaproteobacteria bacterium]|nr:Holliday junction branch migration protein RuvA [Gammaproteobacteria bacterium]